MNILLQCYSFYASNRFYIINLKWPHTVKCTVKYTTSSPYQVGLFYNMNIKLGNVGILI